MRCSRVALSLLLAVLGGAVVALGLADGRNGVAADFCPDQPTYTDTSTADAQQSEFEYVYEYVGRDYQATPDQIDLAEKHDQPDTDEADAANEDDSYVDYEDAYVGDSSTENDPSSDESDMAEPASSESEPAQSEPMTTEPTATPSSDIIDLNDDTTAGTSSPSADEPSATPNKTASEESTSDYGRHTSYGESQGNWNHSSQNTYSQPTSESGSSESYPYQYHYCYPQQKYGCAYGAESTSTTEPSTTETSQYPEPASTDESESATTDHDEPTYAEEDEPTYTEEDESTYAEQNESTWQDPYQSTCVEQSQSSDADESGIETGYGRNLPLEGEPGETIPDHGYGEQSSDYNYCDPYDYYGYDANEPPTAEQPEAETATSASAYDSGSMGLSNSLPSQWLTTEDQAMLRSLAGLAEETTESRRALLSGHLESVGSTASDFCARFEESTGIEPIGLANDTPSAAALLVVCRLIEGGELRVDQGIELLQQSFESLQEAWLEDLHQITSPQPAATGVTEIRTLLPAAIPSWVATVVGQTTELLRSLSHHFSATRWLTRPADQAIHTTDTQWQRF